MNKLNIKAIAMAITLAFGVSAMAQGISKTEYKAGKDSISAEYKTAKAGCASLSGNANDVCIAEVKGRDDVALAKLEASYKPTEKNHYNVRVAMAEANYGVAIQKCDDLAGNLKDVCVKEAKATQITAKAESKAQMKSADANATADEKTADARNRADENTVEAHKSATVEELDAEYTVAKEKCDKFSGATKDTCVDKAKIRFGKS